MSSSNCTMASVSVRSLLACLTWRFCPFRHFCMTQNVWQKTKMSRINYEQRILYRANLTHTMTWLFSTIGCSSVCAALHRAAAAEARPTPFRRRSHCHSDHANWIIVFFMDFALSSWNMKIEALMSWIFKTIFFIKYLPLECIPRDTKWKISFLIWFIPLKVQRVLKQHLCTHIPILYSPGPAHSNRSAAS